VKEIFLSYSRLDQEFADRLSAALQEYGIPVWVDRVSIQAGDAWRAAIAHAIAECDAFLVVLSPQCVASRNVVKELSIAESRNRHIIPVMYQKCEIPPEMEYQLAGLEWVDFAAMNFETAVESLVRVLQPGSRVNRPAQPQAQSTAAPAAQSTGWGQMPFQPPVTPGYPVTQPGGGPQDLARLLCGRWSVQIGTPYIGTMGQVFLEMQPNGVFQGQIRGPAGVLGVTGMWQVMPNGQLMMRGQQSNGWVTGPYMAVVQFGQVTPMGLSGVTGAGEQVTWSKVA
jgi:hypothetical protein